MQNFQVISCISILYSTKYQITFVDFKSKTVDNVLKSRNICRGFEFVFVVLWYFQKDYKYKKSKNSYKGVFVEN